MPLVRPVMTCQPIVDRIVPMYTDANIIWGTARRLKRRRATNPISASGILLQEINTRRNKGEASEDSFPLFVILRVCRSRSWLPP